MALTITPHASDGGVVLYLEGNLDFTVKDMFLTAMKEYEDGYSRLYLNMQDIQYIDSTGIGALALSVSRCQMKNHEVDIKIVNPRGIVKAILRLTNFPSLLPVIDLTSE